MLGKRVHTLIGDKEGKRGSSLERAPAPALRPYIKRLWAAGEKKTTGLIGASRERMLPSGGMHLVFRLSDEPIRIFDSLDDDEGHSFRRGVVGGLRTGFYVKEIARSARTVGATLQPGVAYALFGAMADELAERHTALGDLWGPSTNQLWEQLGDETDLDRQLDRLESFLLRRLPTAHGISPAIAHALQRFPVTTNIGEIVEETGYTHRRFIEFFRRTIGLSPRRYTRVRRFRRAFKLVSHRSWIDLAMEAGYADQAHFIREFREFTGVSPTQYLRLRDGESLHFPIR